MPESERPDRTLPPQITKYDRIFRGEYAVEILIICLRILYAQHKSQRVLPIFHLFRACELSFARRCEM